VDVWNSTLKLWVFIFKMQECGKLGFSNARMQVPTAVLLKIHFFWYDAS
jgi:hypothetical protein